MFKNISKLGVILNKLEQKEIKGALDPWSMRCYSDSDCTILSSLPSFEYERFFCYWGYCQIH